MSEGYYSEREQRIEQGRDYAVKEAVKLATENKELQERIDDLEKALRLAESFLDDSDPGWRDSLRGFKLHGEIRAALFDIGKENK